MQDNNSILVLNDVRASYHQQEILHGISLQVKKNEIIGIIGPNGAGKSTILKAIFGIIQKSKGKVQGNIIFNGKDITLINSYLNVKRGIGFLLQEGEVFSNLTVDDNLALGALNVNKKELADRKEMVYDIFPVLKRFQNKRSGLLSGGERQMLAIAIILIQLPALLLLDEPTAGLAYTYIDKITECIKKIRDEFDITIVLVEQNIQQCLAISDRVYLLKQGTVCHVDTPTNLIVEKKIELLFSLE